LKLKMQWKTRTAAISLSNLPAFYFRPSSEEDLLRAAEVKHWESPLPAGADEVIRAAPDAVRQRLIAIVHNVARDHDEHLTGSAGVAGVAQASNIASPDQVLTEVVSLLPELDSKGMLLQLRHVNALTKLLRESGSSDQKLLQSARLRDCSEPLTEPQKSFIQAFRAGVQSGKDDENPVAEVVKNLKQVMENIDEKTPRAQPLADWLFELDGDLLEKAIPKGCTLGQICSTYGAFTENLAAAAEPAEPSAQDVPSSESVRKHAPSSSNGKKKETLLPPLEETNSSQHRQERRRRDDEEKGSGGSSSGNNGKRRRRG